MEIAAPATAAPTTARRVRFRESLRNVAARSTADDLVRWMLIPASILVIVGFNFMIFGWIGASKTVRQIEQIPYLISGGLVGLGTRPRALVVTPEGVWVAGIGPSAAVLVSPRSS